VVLVACALLAAAGPVVSVLAGQHRFIWA